MRLALIASFAVALVGCSKKADVVIAASDQVHVTAADVDRDRRDRDRRDRDRCDRDRRDRGAEVAAATRGEHTHSEQPYPRPRPVQRSSVRGQILDALRTALVAGELTPGRCTRRRSWASGSGSPRRPSGRRCSSSRSKGRFFQRMIRDRYPYNRI